MAQLVYDAEYEKRLTSSFDKFLPEKVYDAHFHISRKYAQETGYEGEPYAQYTEFTEKYIGRKIVGGLVMPQPSVRHTLEDIHSENAYNIALAEREGLEAGLLMSPDYTREAAESMMDTHKVIKVLKPYLVYSPNKEERYESDILDFAPEWMWSLADDREMPLLLHLSHYQNMLSDRSNIDQLRYVSEKYPKAKIVLAHCAMGHHVQKLKWGLDAIADLKTSGSIAQVLQRLSVSTSVSRASALKKCFTVVILTTEQMSAE